MDNKLKYILKLRNKTIAIFLIIALILSLILHLFVNNLKEIYTDNITEKYTKTYHIVYNQFKELSDVVFGGMSNLANINTVFKELQTADEKRADELRKELYNKVINRYKKLNEKHIKSINFILPNNKMFLKINKPSKYNFEISDKRDTIDFIHKNKKATDSYEIGKHGAGFRFAYPVINKGEYLGIISFTFGAEALTSSIMRQYDVESNFFINEINFNKKLLETRSKLFKVSHHKGYIYDMKVLKELKKVSKKELEERIPDKKTVNKVYKNFLNNNPSSVYYTSLGIIYTTIPIFHKINNDKDAILVIKSKCGAVTLLCKYSYVLIILLNTLLALLFYIVYQKVKSNILEKEFLKQNIEKDRRIQEQEKMVQMGEMIGNIAHQWRQPLSVISTGATGMLMQKEYDMLTDEQFYESCNAINNNAQYLSKTIDDFKNFIKGDRNKTNFALKSGIDSFLNLVDGSIKSHDIKIILDLQREIKIDGYENELKQCFINIFNNAKDILVEKKIEDKFMFITTKIENNKVVIRVKDNGGGIPEDILPKIFEPYFTTKHQSQGTGLGLHMAYNLIVDGMDGIIEANNVTYYYNDKEYYGAEFKITFSIE